MNRFGQPKPRFRKAMSCVEQFIRQTDYTMPWRKKRAYFAPPFGIGHPLDLDACHF
jgi:hypothetical protein